MTKHSYFSYTSTYSSTRHNTTENTTSITPLTQTYNIRQPSKAQKPTIFNNDRYTTNIPTDTTPPPHISISEEIIPCLTRHTRAQLITTKSPFLKSYLHKVDAKSQASPLCPLCNIHTYDTHHLFNCNHIRTTLPSLDLCTDHAEVTVLLDRWTEKLSGGPQTGRSSYSH